jgi:hypothetical protein
VGSTAAHGSWRPPVLAVVLAVSAAFSAPTAQPTYFTSAPCGSSHAESLRVGLWRARCQCWASPFLDYSAGSMRSTAPGFSSVNTYRNPSGP